MPSATRWCVALGEALRRFDADPELPTSPSCAATGGPSPRGLMSTSVSCGPGRSWSGWVGPRPTGPRRASCSPNRSTGSRSSPPSTATCSGLAVGIMLDSDLTVAEAGTRLQVTEVSRGSGRGPVLGHDAVPQRRRLRHRADPDRPLLQCRGGPRARVGQPVGRAGDRVSTWPGSWQPRSTPTRPCRSARRCGCGAGSLKQAMEEADMHQAAHPPLPDRGLRRGGPGPGRAPRSQPLPGPLTLAPSGGCSLRPAHPHRTVAVVVGG